MYIPHSVLLKEEEEQGSQHQRKEFWPQSISSIVFAYFATVKYQATDIMPAINSTPALSLPVDLNEQMFFNNVIHTHVYWNFLIQSFSGFFDVTITESKMQLEGK